ncbi:Interleukin enhancer-binding factor 2-like protein [Acropora cervicornis]|uniref:Interleukin enhancer-binding factor 2-like protein n=1 Tax=Acropora cervicornis TaxID=6130 RepID=A0AAD9QDV5_ACRCE|nr:Interleukin enhancer-binding factor 2-like protein [Acropora cervicornis]
MRRGRPRGMRGGPGRMPPYMRGPPGQKFVVSHSTFDPILVRLSIDSRDLILPPPAENFFPRTVPASDEIAFTQALLKRNQELTPSGQEQASVQNLVTKVTTVLDNLIVTPEAADLGVEEVRAVGSFKKGTMLLGHPVADLAVILKNLPTETIILTLATKVQKSLQEEGSVTEYPMQSNEGGFNISSPDGALVRVLIATLPKNLCEADPAQHVDVKLLEGALATIRHARWFEENAFHTSTRLLAHRAAMASSSRQPLPVNIAFRRAFQLLSSGLFLPGSLGIIDPCEGQEGIPQVALDTEVTSWGGVIVTPGPKAYEKQQDQEDEEVEGEGDDEPEDSSEMPSQEQTEEKMETNQET